MPTSAFCGSRLENSPQMEFLRWTKSALVFVLEASLSSRRPASRQERPLWPNSSFVRAREGTHRTNCTGRSACRDALMIVTQRASHTDLEHKYSEARRVWSPRNRFVT